LLMPFAFKILSVAAFTGLMAAAAVEDFRRLVIPNTIVAGLCVLWPLHLAATPSFTLAGSLGAGGCAVAVFLVGALLFSRGLIGGGDVKLLAVATLWAGPASTPALLIATAVFGEAARRHQLGPLCRREFAPSAVWRRNRGRWGDRDPAAELIVRTPCAHAL
jgi:prepilin peptidase CpaA